MNYSLLDFIMDYTKCCFVHLDKNYFTVFDLDNWRIFAVLNDYKLSMKDGRKVVDYNLQLGCDTWFMVDVLIEGCENYQKVLISELLMPRSWPQRDCTFCYAAYLESVCNN